MNNKKRGSLRPWSPATYQIKVCGQLHENWLNLFEGMGITSQKREDQSTITCLTGPVMDQSHLMGLLEELAELHLPILLVENISENSETNLNPQKSQNVIQEGSVETGSRKRSSEGANYSHKNRS